MDELFEKASRLKTRFPYRGSSTVEDLWDLSVEELDAIYKEQNKKLKATQEESLLNKPGSDDEELVLQVAILKHVVEVKIAEAQARKDAKERKARKQKLMEIYSSKKDEQLKGLSLADLEKLIDES